MTDLTGTVLRVTFNTAFAGSSYDPVANTLTLVDMSGNLHVLDVTGSHLVQGTDNSSPYICIGKHCGT